MSENPLEKRVSHLTPAEKDALSKQIAAGAAVGESIMSMADRLNVSRPAVKRILNAPETQDMIKKIGDDAVSNAKTFFRAHAEQLAAKAFKEIHALLDSANGRDKAEGIKLVYRAIDMDSKESNAGGGTLIVQLPGGKEEKAIEVTGYEVDDGKSGAV